MDTKADWNQELADPGDGRPSARFAGHRRQFGVIVGLCLIVYGQTVFFDFITYDDPKYSYANSFIRNGLNAEGLAWAWSLETTVTHSNWIPLTFLSLMIDAALYGDWSGGYHLTNVVLHVGNSLLLYWLFWQMSRQQLESALVACIFAVHPLHVESVAWVTERKDVLSTLFGLLALLCHVRWVRSKDLGTYVLALVCFALSLLAKQTLVTLPFLLLLLDYWPLRRLTNGSAVRSRLVEKVPYLALSVLFSAIVYFAQRNTMQGYSVLTRLANAGIAYALYVKQTIWPVGLSVFYPHPGEHVSLPAAGLCWLGIAVVSGVVVLQARTRPWLAVGWFWFLGTLVPMVGFVQVGEQRMADRYMYVPQTGLVLAAVWTVSELAAAKSWPARRVKQVWTTVLIALSCAAALQTNLWRDSRMLYAHALAHTQNNATVLHLTATTLAERQQWVESARYFEEARKLDPTNPMLAANYGAMLARAGLPGQARRQLLRAIELEPKHANARADLAVLEEMAGNLDAAVEHVRVAVEADPDSPDLKVMLARLLMLQGKFVEAERHLRRSVASHGKHALSWTYLGFVLLETERRAEAVECFETALGHDPTNQLARIGLVQAQTVRP